MVVVLHGVDQRLSPKAALSRHHARPHDWQRTLAHVGIAAKEVLAVVLVVPVLGDRERGRALVGADLPLHQAPDRLVRLDHQVLADEAGGIGEPIGKPGAGRIEEEARRLDRVAGDDDILRALEPPASLAAVAHARRPAACVVLDPPDHGKVADFGAGLQRSRQPGDEHALLGVGRAADHAHAAIDARVSMAARRGKSRERRRRPGECPALRRLPPARGRRRSVHAPVGISRPLRAPTDS